MYIRMHSCCCIYILFTDLEIKKRRDLQCIFLSCVSFTFLGWRTKRKKKKKQPHTDLQSTQDMHAKWNICLTEQRVFREKGIAQFCNRHYVSDRCYCIA